MSVHGLEVNPKSTSIAVVSTPGWRPRLHPPPVVPPLFLVSRNLSHAQRNSACTAQKEGKKKKRNSSWRDIIFNGCNAISGVSNPKHLAHFLLLRAFNTSLAPFSIPVPARAPQLSQTSSQLSLITSFCAEKVINFGLPSQLHAGLNFSTTCLALPPYHNIPKAPQSTKTSSALLK